jgi:DNA/RNA-binding domain of Phe-tRNA-synthetase-like protein
MTQMNGTPKIIRAGDMVMRDAGSLACSILYGQDNRSPISPDTSHVLYVAYAPAGVPVESVEAHLRRIEANIRLFAKSAVLEQLRLLTSSG